jgi:hypothetical protein
MATRGRSTRSKAVSKKRRPATKGSAKKAAKSRGAKSAGRSASKTAKRPAKRPARKAAKRPAVKRAAPKPKSQSPIARVKRVAQVIAVQAQTAMHEGVDLAREVGENLADRLNR